METCQLTSDYFKESLQTNERIPLILRKHINDCQDCQIKIIEIGKEIEIHPKVFGKNFDKVRLGWIGEVTEIPLNPPAFFQTMREFSERHKKYILTTTYTILILFMFKELF
jgi:hypothetical protein